jgi:hypothetical protein
MVFCGQCGLQLAPGSTRCPRCGAAVEGSDMTAAGELYSNDQTIASASPSSLLTQQNDQQQPPLILRPDTPGVGSSGNTYGTQTATYNYDATTNYDATSLIDQPTYQAPHTQMGGSYANYPTQFDERGYPMQNPGYPVQNGSGYGYPLQNPGGGYQTGMSYPPQTGYQLMQGNYQQEERDSVNARGRTTGLVLVLLGLIMVLSAVILFAIQQNFI